MRQRSVSALARFFHRFGVVGGSVGMTLALFLVLPLLQRLGEKPDDMVRLVEMNTAVLPPPPPVIEEVEEEEPEPEEEPPELQEQPEMLDLSQLELALNPGLGDGWFAGDFAVDLNAIGGAKANADALFSMADLDQKPRVLYRANPVWNAKMRKLAPGTVYILFVVDERGRVKDPKVQSSTDPAFERAALTAVKQWKFEPGKRKGEPVQFRMRQPITFPK